MSPNKRAKPGQRYPKPGRSHEPQGSSPTALLAAFCRVHLLVSLLEQGLGGFAVVGEASDVVRRMQELAQRTRANELMVTAVAFDIAARVRSLELLAQHWPGGPSGEID